MAGVEVDAAQRGGVDPGDRAHEVDGLADGVDDLLVLGAVPGAAGERQVPVLGVVQVGEPAVGEGADEVERERGALVAAQHQLGIGLPILAGEGEAVDQVPAIRRQRDLAAPLEVGGARLGILPGDATDPHHLLARAVDQDQAHLHEDLQLGRDALGVAVLEALGAVTALQQERVAAGGPRQLGLEGLDLPRGHQRRQPRDLLDHALQHGLVRIDRLLGRHLLLPGFRCPFGHDR